MPKFTQNLLILTGIALVLLAIYFSQNPRYKSIEQQQTGNKSTASSNHPSSASARPARSRSVGASKLPPSTHEYTELKNFIIPELKLDQTSLKQALYQLRDHYYNACQLTGEQPIHFKFVIHGTPIDPHTITITNRSFLKNLNILALLSGMELTREGNIITFSAIDSIGSNNTKTIIVPPDTVEILASLHQGTADAEASDILKQLAHAGQTDLSFDPAKSTLTLSGDSLEIERIENLIKQYIRTPVSQIRILTKIVKVPTENLETFAASPRGTLSIDTKSAQTYTAGETQMILRGLAQTPGTDIHTFPSGLSRPNESSTIEFIREVIYPSPTAETEFTKDWTGFKITTQPSRLGLGSMPKLTFNRGIMNPSNNPETPLSIEHRVDRIENYIPYDKTIMVPIQSDEGTTSFLFLTLEEIDAAGTKIKR